MRTHPVLEQLAQSGVRLGLERIRTFLQVLGEPQLSAPVVHVAGTNGKGSTCAMVTAALVDAGYRVGTLTSPHLEEVNERIALDGLPIDDATFIEVLEQVDRARWEWARSAGMTGEVLTYFEFTTAMGFVACARLAVDVMVVEVGLGGRLDATNVVHPVVTAVTHIGLDHVAELGDTLEAVAAEKAGILERGVPVVVGPMPAKAREVVAHRARVLDAPRWSAGPRMRREARRDGTFSFATPGGELSRVTLGLAGRHQGANALVALALVHQLRGLGFRVPDDAVRSGFGRAFVPGRLERPLPGLVIDGAHNIDGALALAAWLADQPRPASRILLVGMGHGRDPAEVLAPLIEHVDEVVTTRCAHPKAREPVDLAMALRDLTEQLAAGGSIEDTLPEVYREAHQTVVAGSLFIAGAARALVAAGALTDIEPGQGLADDLDEVDHSEVGR